MFRRKLSLLILLLALPAFACQLSGGDEPTSEPAPTAEVVTEDPTAVPEAATDEPAPTAEVATEEPTAAPDPTDAPEPTPEPTTPDNSNFINHESSDLGLTVSYPPDWVLEEDGGGFISIASSEEVLAADTFTEGAGLILVADPNLGALAAEEILTLFATDESIISGLVAVEPPQAMIINGQSAFRGRYTGSLDEVPVNATLTAIVSGGAGSVAIGITPPSGNEDLALILDQIVGTIILEKPPEPISEGTITLGEQVSGSVTDGLQSTWAINVNAGDAVDIVVTPEESLDVIVDVRDSLGLSILPDGSVDESFGEEALSGVVFENAGTFQIVLSGFGDSQGAYTLTVNPAGSAPTSESVNLTPNTSVTAQLSESGKDSYIINLLGGAPVTIEVEPLDEGDVVIEVLDANGAFITSSDSSFGKESFEITPPADGDYTITVEEFTGNPTQYTIIVIPGGATSNNGGNDTIDVFVPADLIAVQDTNSVSQNGSTDYAIPANPYQIFTVLVVTEGDFDAVVEVYDPSGTLVQDQDNSFTEEELIVIPEEAGEYIVSVRGFDNTAIDYAITISYGGPGGAGVTGSILRASDFLDPGESHAFPFFTLGEQVVAAIVEPDGFDIIIGLTDDNSEERLLEVDDAFGYERFSSTTPAEGDYFVFVEGFDAEEDTGDYEIILIGGPDVAFELANGDIVNGVFGDSGLLGYTYKGLAGETIIITAAPTADLDLVIDIEPAEGDPYVTADEFIEGGTEVATYTFTADETIFIFLRGFNGATGRFEMIIEVE